MYPDKNKIVLTDKGKKWVLPKVFQFGSIWEKGKPYALPNFCEYEFLGFRNPKEGDWFISGAIPAAYKANHDQTYPMIVVKPTKRVVMRNVTVFEYV